jgi:hypothetical protein
MRRLKFIIPMLLLAGACSAPSAVEPTAAAGEAPFTSVISDNTATDSPADTTPQRGDSGILIGSGT